jgi:hypothetical protein
MKQVTQLLEAGEDPTVLDARGRPAYAVAATKEVRDAIRRYAASEMGQGLDLAAAGIPSALTPEMEAQQAVRQVGFCGALCFPPRLIWQDRVDWVIAGYTMGGDSPVCVLWAMSASACTKHRCLWRSEICAEPVISAAEAWARERTQAEKKAKMKEREKERKKRAAERKAKSAEELRAAAEAEVSAAAAEAAAAAARCAVASPLVSLTLPDCAFMQ